MSEGEQGTSEPQGGGSEPQQQYWTDLYERCYRQVASYFSKYVKCPQDVEDLVQEVFARLIAHRHYLQHPQAYVRAVAKHRLYSYWRNRRRDATSEQQAIVRCSGAVMGLTTCDWESDPLEQLTHREAQAMVGTMITCLSPTLGEALRLRFMGDLRSNEATARTGCSLGAWKKRLVRARRAFTELADGAATYRAAHLPGKRIDGESLTGLQSA